MKYFTFTEVPLAGLTASQSSTLTNGEAEKAIDGNANPMFADGFCQSTESGKDNESKNIRNM